jgi:hypothetical protein
MIAALQSQITDLKLARKQANELVTRLMGEKLTDEQRQALFQQVLDHLLENDDSKANTMTGVLKATLMGLHQVAQTTTDQQTKSSVVEMIKGLNIVLEST